MADFFHSVNWSFWWGSLYGAAVTHVGYYVMRRRG